MNQLAPHFMAQHTGELILAQASGRCDSLQAAWRNQAQREFLAWLRAGGFNSQAEQQHYAGTESTICVLAMLPV